MVLFFCSHLYSPVLHICCQKFSYTLLSCPVMFSPVLLSILVWLCSGCPAPGSRGHLNLGLISTYITRGPEKDLQYRWRRFLWRSRLQCCKVGTHCFGQLYDPYTYRQSCMKPCAVILQRNNSGRCDIYVGKK